MIQEAYCSFEVAKLLKEKGFNESCYTYYDDIDNSINRFDKGLHFNNTSYPWGVPYDLKKAKKYIVAPTHQMAMAWLREEYGISIEISALKLYRWVYTIYRLFEKRVVEVWNDGPYISYDAATDYALKYCLENLNKFI